MNPELSTCRAMLNDAVVNDWLVRSPFLKAKKGELIAVAHEAKRQIVLSSENEQNDNGYRAESSGECKIASLILYWTRGVEVSFGFRVLSVWSQNNKSSVRCDHIEVAINNQMPNEEYVTLIFLAQASSAQLVAVRQC